MLKMIGLPFRNSPRLPSESPRMIWESCLSSWKRILIIPPPLPPLGPVAQRTTAPPSAPPVPAPGAPAPGRTGTANRPSVARSGDTACTRHRCPAHHPLDTGQQGPTGQPWALGNAGSFLSLPLRIHRRVTEAHQALDRQLPGPQLARELAQAHRLQGLAVCRLFGDRVVAQVFVPRAVIFDQDIAQPRALGGQGSDCYAQFACRHYDSPTPSRGFSAEKSQCAPAQDKRPLSCRQVIPQPGVTAEGLKDDTVHEPPAQC